MTFDLGYGWANLVLPFAVLALSAILVPLVLSRVLPQSMPGLGVAALASAIILAGLCALYLTWSYLSAGVENAFGLGITGSLKAALIWAPIAAVVLLQQPSRWRPDLE